MSESQLNKILATLNAKDFIGRESELDALRRHANGENKSLALLLLSAPAVGASEFLKQTYDRLFQEQSETIPFYFAVKESDKTAKNCAARFLQAFITQAVAFRRRDAKIIDIAPDVCELAELAAPSDGYWIDRLVAACQIESRLNEDCAFVRNCLSASLRAAAYGANSFVMIDNLHEADFFSDEIDFIEEIKEVFSRLSVPFVLSGRRRFLFKKTRTGDAKFTDAKILPVEPLDFSDAGLLTEKLAAKYTVGINDQTRDLIARQFAGNPTFIKFLIQAASGKRINLDSFRRVGQVYTDELFGGGTGKFYDAIFCKIAPNIETQKNIIEVLFNSAAAETGTERRHLADIFKVWETTNNLSSEDFYRLSARLDTHEIINLSSSLIEPASDNEVLSDYIKARFQLEVAAENRAWVVGAAMSQFIKRAPQTMAKFYRCKSAIGLRELLAVFNRQETPAGLLDYSVYKEQLENSETFENSLDETEKIVLPQIIFTAHTAAFYPPFEQVAERSRSAVALGFDEQSYTDSDETVWLAAEIDSKLEASKEKAEFWCDRLEMAALMCNFSKYKIWLVAPKGFAPDAIDILRQRNAYGSSREQVELLAKFLKAETLVKERPSANEYEIVVPMGEDTELIAAGAVEEIARRHHFAPKAVNQIKTALVEACINATEHSLSPDRKIHQKIVFEKDKLIITISNRGLRLTDKKAEEIAPVEGRRGWGLKLMKTLMDEVKFEQVDDGTRISMTKYLR